MRILFLSTWFPYPPDNGSKLRVYHLLHALSQKHEVTLVSFAFDTAQPEVLGNLRALCADVRVVSLNPFVENKVGTLRTFLSLRPMTSRSIPAMRELVASVLHLHAFDAVIASTEMMATYADAAPVGAPKILEEHNSMSRWAWERYDEQTDLFQRARCWVSWHKQRWYTARTFPRCALVTMVSEADRQATLSAVGIDRLRVEVVPNGVDCGHNRPGLAQPRPTMLVYNGALTYSANYDAMQWFLAEVYPRIKTVAPGVSLTITGATKGVDLAGLALDTSVHLIGYVDDVRLPVAEAAICVVPIRQGGGTRLKILEAMALGTPVVATSKGAEGLDVVNGEHLLLGDTPEALADAVLRVMGDSVLRERLCRSARALVERRYDWKTIGAQFVTLVEETARS
ncbi:MAG: glycosyltransferase [Anaerolineae bacterium]|nr:glycosyltransferase [Anaerolineae bacterium]